MKGKQMMKLVEKKECGQALALALIMLGLAGLLVVPLLMQSFTNVQHHQLLECKTITSYSADAGMQYAETMIFNNPGAYIDTPLQESFTLNDRTVNVTAEYMEGGMYALTSTASGGGCGRTRIRGLVNISHGAFAYAIAAKDKIIITNSTVDSVPDPGEANIHANVEIVITGGQSVVNGDASAVTTITGQEYITGTIEEYSDNLMFPETYADLYRTIAQEGGTHEGSLKIDDGGTHYLGPLYINGNLEVNSNSTVILEGPLYIVGNLVQQYAHIDGNEYMVTEGNVVIKGGGYGTLKLPVVVSLYGKIDLHGPVVDAVLYAPEGNVNLAQGVKLYGAMGGVQCIIKGQCEIIYAESLHGRTDLPGADMFTVTYSYD